MAKKTKAVAKTKTKTVEIALHEIEVRREYGGRASGLKPCPFCKHYYIKPCSDTSKTSCPNFKHLQGGKRGNK